MVKQRCRGAGVRGSEGAGEQGCGGAKEILLALASCL